MTFTFRGSELVASEWTDNANAVIFTQNNSRWPEQVSSSGRSGGSRELLLFLVSGLLWVSVKCSRLTQARGIKLKSRVESIICYQYDDINNLKITLLQGQNMWHGRHI